MTELRETVSRVKTKNAGPFRLTIDLFFDDEESYQRVKESETLTESELAHIYDISTDDVLGIYYVDFIRSIKITLRRPIPQGHPEETDVFGMGQPGPVLSLEV